MQRATRPSIPGSESIPAVGFRNADRLTAVGIVAFGDAVSVAEGIASGFRERLTAICIVALGDALSVAEGIGDGFRDRRTAVAILALSDVLLVAEGIGAGLRDADRLCRSGSSTGEGDR
jgi:putative component of toxin-antitoxin plasmid stabilization module